MLVGVDIGKGHILVVEMGSKSSADVPQEEAWGGTGP